MSAIRYKDTAPEMIVRRMVHGLGYRYRLHGRKLPGCPDLVFASRRKVIFVHGCFWHRHDCDLGKPQPKTRPEFWSAKFEGNVRRDKEIQRKLRDQGWEVLVIWQCGLYDEQALKERVDRFLSGER